MFDLFSFYRSKEWANLLKQLKAERVNDEGFIICEYCGKPIIKAYDIIGHHKEELTEDNVNDFNVSLNPNNIAFVHHRCHNFIHNKLNDSYRKVYLVYGSPLAGKRTWVGLNKAEGDLIIDIDSIWEAISGCDRYIKPPKLKSNVFKIRDTLLDSVKYRFGKWNNCYIIGGYPLQAERERLCRELGAEEIFIDTSKEECLKRLENDEGRSKIEGYSSFIDDWFDKYTRPAE